MTSARMNLALLCLLPSLFACKREDRRFQDIAVSSVPTKSTQVSGLRAGGPKPSPSEDEPYPAGYEESAYAISEGQRLYNWMNCVGCHAHGGGAIGPALMDSHWIYGSSPQNIFDTIVQGRPNGMPSFGGKLPEQQVWQLAAYVRSLSGLTPKDARPVRDDNLSVTSAPSMQTAEKPAGQPPEAPAQ